MTKQKKKRICLRPLIAIAAIISILLTGSIVANAATDGAVAENVAAVAQKIEDKITFIIDGKEVKIEEINEDDKKIINDVEVLFTNAEGEYDSFNIEIENGTGYKTYTATVNE